MVILPDTIQSAVSLLLAGNVAVSLANPLFADARLSTAHTDMQVQQDSTLCPALLERLEQHFAQASTRWNPDPWEYAFTEPVSWIRMERESSFQNPVLRLRAPVPTDSLVHGWRETDQCSLVVQRNFYVDHDTLSFTYGRIPEGCSEAPALIWRSPDDRWLRRAIPPLFNWNVATMWCTEHYLVFGLEADYEFGSHSECLAFWHLPSGNIELALQTNWSYEEQRSIRPPVLLPDDFPEWRRAKIVEVDDGLALRWEEKALLIWPSRRQVALIGAATVDCYCYNESEQITGWFTMIEENLVVPFETMVLGVPVTVEHIDLNRSEEIVIVNHERDLGAVELDARE